MCFLELMAFKAVGGTSLGIWNFTMPTLSDAAYDRSTFGLVVSLKT